MKLFDILKVMADYQKKIIVEMEVLYKINTKIHLKIKEKQEHRYNFTIKNDIITTNLDYMLIIPRENSSEIIFIIN